MPQTPAERRLQARMAAHAAHAKHGKAMTVAARAGLEAKWAAEVDPEGALAPDERARRVEQRRRQHLALMSMKAAEARRKKRAAG